MPSSSAKQVDKGKEKAIEPIIVEQEDKHETEQEFQLIESDEEDEDRVNSAVIRGKKASLVLLSYSSYSCTEVRAKSSRGRFHHSFSFYELLSLPVYSLMKEEDNPRSSSK